MNLLFLSLFFIGMSSHDIQLAHFEIHQKNDNLIIEFAIDHDDMLSAHEGSNIELTDELLQEYISSNFSVSINGTRHDLSFGTMTIKGEHINLVGQISNLDQVITTIDIENTCLLNIEGHSNIIKLKLYEKQRDFLMNKERTSIQITY